MTRRTISAALGSILAANGTAVSGDWLTRLDILKESGEPGQAQASGQDVPIRDTCARDPRSAATAGSRPRARRGVGGRAAVAVPGDTGRPRDHRRAGARLRGALAPRPAAHDAAGGGH